MSAQPPDSAWLGIYGEAAGDEAAFAVTETADGMYFVAGRTESFGAGGSDVWLLKLDRWGDTLWTRTYGGTLNEDAQCIQPTPDGGCIMAGHTRSYASGLSDIWIVKVNKDGDVEKATNYGGALSDQAYDIQPTNDGGYIIAGYSGYVPQGDTLLGDQVYLVKTDSLGEVQWARSYGGPYQDYGRAVVQTPDGGYLIAGNTYTDYTGDAEVLLLRTNSSGGLIWAKTFGFENDDFAYALLPNAEDGYTIIGTTELAGFATDVYVIRIDTSGTELGWAHYGAAGSDYAFAARRTPRGTIVVAGYTYSFGGTTPDFYLSEITDAGDTLWTRNYTYGDGLREFCYDVLPTTDQGYLMVGYTGYPAAPHDDLYALKLGGQLEPHVFRRMDLYYAIEFPNPIEDTLLVAISPLGASAWSLVSVDVLLDTLRHTSTGDLEITLSHDGVTDTIVYRAGGDGDDFIGTRLSDAAATPVSLGRGPFSCLYRPYKPLSAFTGFDPNGDWILTVRDVQAGESGELVAWGLRFLLDPATGIAPASAIVPSEFELYPNYPNPFNAGTRIRFDLPEPAHVKLEIFDLLGRRVDVLVDQGLAAGVYEPLWHADAYSSGVYFYRLSTGTTQAARKMILLK